MTGLRLDGVSKRFGSVQALDGIDLAIEAGRRTAIVGASGSGKSTLLRIVAGFERPDAGRVTLGGEMVAGEDVMIPAHRRGIGYVSQDGALFPHLTVEDNIGFGIPRRQADRRARIATLMEMLELGPGMLARRPHELSGGQQQRVSLARALARGPKLMLLDEPFSALDPALREGTRQVVASVLGQAGVTAILVTHDLQEALSYADRVALLSLGRLVTVGAPGDLYFRPGDRETALFVGEAIILPATIADGQAQCALGQIPVDDPRPRHATAATIMLRHEQLKLLPVGGPSEAPSGVRGRVLAVGFRGASCKVELAIEPEGREAGATEAATSLRLEIITSSLEMPEVGAHLSITVRGRAHVMKVD